MIYLIYRDGRHYDRLFPGTDEDLAFWISQARRFDGPILELACGTGKVSVPLAREGFEVTGIDLSAEMLREAARKADREKVQVEWLSVDIRDFHLDRLYNLILLPGNSLCHLLEIRDVEACFACVRNHLRPGGHFIIDVFVPDLKLLLRRPDERQPFAKYADPDGSGTIVVTSTQEYDQASQINHITTYHTYPDRAEESIGTLSMRMFFPQELDALLKYNGFFVDRKYGTYSQDPFDQTSSRQLVVCSLEEPPSAA